MPGKINRRNNMEELVNKQNNDIVQSRQAQEVQASMIVAKKFPRDELEAYNRIRKACKRKNLALSAVYSYPRGGVSVEGASIRLAEVLAQNWGNIDCGIIELNRKLGVSEMMAYAWDMETNTRVTKIFTTKHIRDKKSGNVSLTDERDIYELTANMGARRLRACILAIIPQDVVEDAIKECKETLRGSYKEPLKDRIKKMVAVFEDNHGVTKDMIEKMFGYSLEALTEYDYEKLRTIYTSLNDKMSAREDWFQVKKEKIIPKSSLDIEEEKEQEKKGDLNAGKETMQTKDSEQLGLK